MAQEALAFALALLGYWALLLGSVVMFALDAVSRSSRHSDATRHKWLTDHRVFRRLSVACLFVGCFLTWKDQYRDVGELRRGLDQERGETTRLRENRDTQQRQITDLQTKLATQEPLVLPPAAVNVFTGSSGQSTAFVLSSDNPSLSWTSMAEWTRPKSAFEIPISWDDMSGFRAVADFRLYAGYHEHGWGQARIFDLTTEQVAADTPQLETGPEGKLFRLEIPRAHGQHTYVLQLRAQDNSINVNALGRIMIVKQ